jgi:hypothetical protein
MTALDQAKSLSIGLKKRPMEKYMPQVHKLMARQAARIT